MTRPWRRWSVLWRQENKRDGKKEYLVGDHGVLPIFQTRQAARDFIKERYGYIKRRADLQSEPHGWKMPKAVRVNIVPD